MISKKFVLAGKAIFTVNVPSSFSASRPECKPHYTYRVDKVEANGKFAESYFVKLLSGPDNNRDYSYMGKLDVSSGNVVLTAKSVYREDSLPVQLIRRVFARLWADQLDQVEAAGFDIHHEGRCGRCGRRLTVPSSILSGLGPECEKMD